MKEISSIFSKYRDVLLKEDPMGIYFEDLKNMDEYDSEINLILSKIGNCKTQNEAYELIIQIFSLKFGNLSVDDEKILRRISETLFEIQAHN